MTVGERIKSLRQQHGLTQAELGRLAGLSRQCLYEYESDRADPKLFNAACIADVFGITLDELAGRTPHD